NPEETQEPESPSTAQLKAVAAVSQITVASAPVRSAPVQNSYALERRLQSPWPGGGGLEDIRSAIKQLTLRSRDSSSTATSGASSAGGGSNNGAQDARRRRVPLVRQPSLDTNVTSADEFVWVDSHNRLVELRCVPWSAGDISRALQTGRCRDVAGRFSTDAPPRLAYLLQRALVRVAREAQRLSQNFGFCSKHEVAGAFRVILSTPLAESCIKGCQRAATMYATSGGAARRLGSATRARTSLVPGRFLRWMLDVRVASFVHEYAAIYLCAGIETLLEEIVVIGGAAAANSPITPASIDHAVANCAHLWGLLQPYSHLNAGRIASGALSLSRWESMSSLGSGSGSSSGAPRPEHKQLGLSHDSGITTGGSGTSGSNTSSGTSSSVSSGASVLLTTCAGSAAELRAVLRQLGSRHPPLSPQAERALYYFMRCSQRGAGALPPLGEWVRVARAHAALRPPPAVPDADDVLQAARLLLPHADCPPRPVTLEEAIEPVWSRCSRTGEELSRAALGLAQRALLSGRPEFLGGVRTLLPQGVDATDAAGLTALMKAALAGDEQVVAMLLEAGADPNIETPGAGAQPNALLSPRSNGNSPSTTSPGQSSPANSYTPPTAGWTALVYACSGAGAGCVGAVEVARRLLAAGARVDGAPASGEDVACGVGNLELVQLLLSHGADPFLSTQLNDALCYSAAAQYGCYRYNLGVENSGCAVVPARLDSLSSRRRRSLAGSRHRSTSSRFPTGLSVRRQPLQQTVYIRVSPPAFQYPEIQQGRLFYGHKIVLVTESPRLRAMLAPPRASHEALPATNTASTPAPPLVQINDIRYHIFEQVMKYLYSGDCSTLDIPEADVLEVLAAASFFQLLPLQRHCEARAAKSVDLHNLVSVYIHAKVYGATQLLEYCQGFLLQNMVALLTYDDSVKRLLFGKRLPGHNKSIKTLVIQKNNLSNCLKQYEVQFRLCVRFFFHVFFCQVFETSAWIQYLYITEFDRVTNKQIHYEILIYRIRIILYYFIVVFKTILNFNCLYIHFIINSDTSNLFMYAFMDIQCRQQKADRIVIKTLNYNIHDMMKIRIC
ncbi:unnamed protein product, partial [Leptidea sinapis]